MQEAHVDDIPRRTNARPRDALGRPLPYGSAGVAPLPDDAALPPEQAIAEAQRLLERGRPFQAHEVLEAVWKAASAPEERELWRGLAQLAVGVTHLARGNATGGSRLLRRGAANLDGYYQHYRALTRQLPQHDLHDLHGQHGQHGQHGPLPYGVDVVGLRRWAGDLADAVDEQQRTEPASLPRYTVPALGRAANRLATYGQGMNNRILGRTGVSVSPLCLGAMMFGRWGNPGHDDSIKIIHRALDAGINFVDTADAYSEGESERIVGKALADGRRRDDVVLATKVFAPMDDDPNHRGLSRRWIVTECENSLRRLDTDWIDLYQVHRPDPNTDIDETLSALTDLVRAGKIRYFGCSTFPAHQVVEAQWASQRRGLERFVTEQPPYSLLVRGIEADLLPVCQKYGMGVLPWSPLAGGFLSGRYRAGVDAPASRRAARVPARYDLTIPENQAKLAAVESFALLAEEIGVTLVELALAFVIQHPAITSAIIGPRTMEHLESQLTATEIELDEAVLDRIDEIVPPGTNVSSADAGWVAPALADKALRRRH